MTSCKKAVSAWIISQAMERSTTGNWIVSFSEIEDFLGYSMPSAFFDSLLIELFNNDIVMDVDICNDCVDIIIGTDYVVNFCED